MPTKRKSAGPNVTAAALVAATTGLEPPTGVYEALMSKLAAKSDKNPAAVALGRLGGLKGGKARAEALSAAERKKIASDAAKARWAKKSKKKTPREKLELQVYAAVRNGVTAVEVAKKFGLSTEAVLSVSKRVHQALLEKAATPEQSTADR